jgi:hypothetical protein
MESQMSILASAQKMNVDLHFGIYHDNGCCGCTQGRRRLLFLLIALGGLIGAFVALGSGSDSSTVSALFALAGIFLVCALMCPNGPCGMYAADKSWGVLKPSDVTGLCGASKPSGTRPEQQGLLSGHDVEAGSDPASQANVATIHRYFNTYNGGAGGDAAMQAFVATCYADTYSSTSPGNITRKKSDMVGVFREAWEKRRQCSDIQIMAVRPDAAVYSYILTFQGNVKPMRLRAAATFEPPGVLRSVTFTTA